MRSDDRTLADRPVGGVRQPLDLGIVGPQRIAFGEHFLQTVGLGVEQLFELGGVFGNFLGAEGAQHAIERVERHAVLGRDRLDLCAVEVGQIGDGEQQLPPLAGDQPLLAGRLVRHAEIEQAQGFVDPWPLLALVSR